MFRSREVLLQQQRTTCKRTRIKCGVFRGKETPKDDVDDTSEDVEDVSGDVKETIR